MDTAGRVGAGRAEEGASTVTTYDRLAEILVHRFDIEPEAVRPDSTFEELEMDSLFLVEFMLVVQKELGATVDEEDAGPKDTIAGVAELIDRRAAAAP